MSEDVIALNGMTAETVIIVLECACSIMTGVAVSLLICWQQTTVALLLSPLVTTATYLQLKLKYGRKEGGKYENKVVDDYEKANALLFDVILNYRTVITFGQKNID